MLGRFGAIGSFARRAGSRMRNCSPFCRCSMLSELGVLVAFQQRLIKVLCRLVVAGQLPELLLALGSVLDALPVSGSRRMLCSSAWRALISASSWPRIAFPRRTDGLTGIGGAAPE